MALEHYTSGIGDNRVYVLQGAEGPEKNVWQELEERSWKREPRVTGTVASQEKFPGRKVVALITMISYPDKGGRPERSVHYSNRVLG